MSLLERIRDHEHSPRWNHQAGDRLTDADRAALELFREELAHGRRHAAGRAPGDAVLRWVSNRIPQVDAFRESTSACGDLARDWARIRTTSRETIAASPEKLVPHDADLERMIVYKTSGTTGHALQVPHHPAAAAAYLPMMEIALARHGVKFEPRPDAVACFLVGAQARTVTYPALLTFWNRAGFAKLNLHPADWRAPGDAAAFFADLAPAILTGDPLSFSTLLEQGVPARPKAVLSTAVAMSTPLRARLQRALGCPVVDWYSLTETGPIGFACPRSDAYHILPHDIYVEVIGEDGAPVADGERGEIAVTGGRNPYLPLLRYRTGDWGRRADGPCACGDPAPRLVELEGRRPVWMRSAHGERVNPVDLSRVLRSLPLLQHELTQHSDGNCSMRVRWAGAAPADGADGVRAAVRALLGDVAVDVAVDPTLGDRTGGKTAVYRSEGLLEE